ncbi:Glycerol-3-phosphate O-acyltransferase 1 [Smittium culicis]|uniref:Glycerol-3-phosphate O-acyltransferase 1 n=1 Tax=Smittium culicis TaxID=133412 RepID=A0A1R1XSK0_9FUNG|nr:Glycerol-3-phosphate O-acyltransferase 1 [Smittium culicis]
MEYFLYDIIRAFWIQVVSIFFREIASGNAHSVPKEGPVIFVVAPHNNQFVDPLILFKHSPRRVYFLVAASSLKRRIVGFYGRLLRGIPVERAMDHKKKGVGMVTSISNSDTPDPLRIFGLETNFLSEFQPGDRISILSGKHQAKVVKIVSNSELLLDSEVSSPEVMAALSSQTGCAYDRIPALDQKAMYKSVYDRLNANECIGIFPEGGSHDQSKMLPLKIGVCLMALGASADNPNLKLNIVPAGLNYFHPSKFRSRAVIEFGNPIPIDPELVEMFNKGGEDKRKACSTLLEVISEALKQVTLNTPDSDTLQLVHTCRRLYNPTKRTISMRNQVELSRRFVKGYMQLKDNTEVSAVIKRVLDYKKKLEYYGIRDHQVEKLHMDRFDAIKLFTWRFIWLVFTGSLALSGAVLNLPVFIVTRIVSRIKAKEALAASTVKLKATDVIATWKILVGLVFIPTLYTLYSILYVFYAKNFRFLFFLSPSPNSGFLFSFFQGILLTTFISLASLNFGERAVDIFKSLKPLYTVILDSDNISKKIISERAELSITITQLVNELGPQIYPEYFNKLSESDSESTESSSGIRKRINSKGDGISDSETESKPSKFTRFSIPSITPKFLSKIRNVSSFDFLGTGTDKIHKLRKSKDGNSAEAKIDTPEPSGGYFSQLFSISNIFQVGWFDNSQDSNLPELAEYSKSIKYSGSSYSTDDDTGLSSASHSRNSSVDSSFSADGAKAFGMSPLDPKK